MAQTLSADQVTGESTENVAVALSRQRLIPVLVALLLGMLLAALDQTVVGTAMPRVIADLGGSNISWVYTAYLLASTVAVPIYGKLSDIYGRRIFFIGGMVLFLLGSALSGTSQSMTQLIIYRAIQGLGAGALMPIAQAIIGDIFTPAERGKWQGLFTGVFGLATIVGPILGGFITDNWGWRWTFYVNMPVGAVALVAAALTLPRLSQHRQHKIDYFGSAALVLWSVPLLLALSFGGNQYAWNSWQIIAMFVFAAVMLIAFIVIELRAAEPIISPRLFTNSIFIVSVFTMFLLSAGMFGAILYLPYFVQDVMGQSATNSGAILTPMMLGFIFASLVSGLLLSRTGKYKVIALVEFAIGAVGMFLFSRMTVDTTNGELLRNMVITGLGIGGVMSLFTIVVQNAFPLNKIGEVTASLSFFRSMGGTIGLAVLGAVLTNGFSDNLKTNMAKVMATLPTAVRQHLPSGGISSIGQIQGSSAALQAKFAALGPEGIAIYHQLMLAVRTSFSSAITEVFLIGAVMMALSFVATLFLREIPLRKSLKPAEASTEAAQAETEPLAVDLTF